MSERTQVHPAARGLALVCPDPEELDEDPIRGGDWLLRAADDEGAARKAWLNTGVALLNCGEVVAAVRIDAEVVWAAAGTQDLAEVDAFLFGALCGGPVFMDPKAHHYYALVSPLRAAGYVWSPRRPLPPRGPDARLLSGGSYIGVPMPERIVPDGHLPYWCVPAGEVRTLCSPHAVLQLLSRGRFAVAQQGEGPCR